MQQEEQFHKARQIIEMEQVYQQNILPKFGQVTFEQWIMSSDKIGSREEFSTLYQIGKIFKICDICGIPRSEQPCNRQHFEVLSRYVHNTKLLADVWRGALVLAGNVPQNVTLQHLGTSSQRSTGMMMHQTQFNQFNQIQTNNNNNNNNHHSHHNNNRYNISPPNTHHHHPLPQPQPQQNQSQNHNQIQNRSLNGNQIYHQHQQQQQMSYNNGNISIPQQPQQRQQRQQRQQQQQMYRNSNEHQFQSNYIPTAHHNLHNNGHSQSPQQSHTSQHTASTISTSSASITNVNNNHNNINNHSYEIAPFSYSTPTFSIPSNPHPHPLIPVPHSNYNGQEQKDEMDKGQKKRGRKKGSGNRANKVSDEVIINHWQQNTQSTLLAVQKKFGAGYNRVKKLKEKALKMLNNDNHDNNDHDHDNNNNTHFIFNNNELNNFENQTIEQQLSLLPSLPPSTTTMDNGVGNGFNMNHCSNGNNGNINNINQIPPIPVPLPPQQITTTTNHNHHMIESSEDDEDENEITDKNAVNEDEDDRKYPLPPSKSCTPNVSSTNSKKLHNPKKDKKKKSKKKKTKKRKLTRNDSISSYHTEDDDDDDDDDEEEYHDKPPRKKRKLNQLITRSSTSSISSMSTPEPPSLSLSSSISPSNKKNAKKNKKKRKVLATPSEFVISATQTAEKIKYSHQRSRRKPSWIIKTLEVLKKLRQDPLSYFFNKPVDPILLDAHDYHLVVQNPMDLETLTNNLSSNKYSKLSQFIEDAELIFINAKIYNPIHHNVHTAAIKLQQLFKSSLQSIVANYADDDTLNRWQLLDQPGGFKWGIEHKTDIKLKKETNNHD